MQVSLQALLRAANVTFIPNEQQVDALEKITKFFDDRGEFDSFVLKGYAGTGKTTIVKLLLTYAKMRGFYDMISVTAPTHRAKAVIAKLAGKASTTIHKVLGMRPDVDVDELDLRALRFNTKLTPTMNVHGVLIIDEASMIGDALMEHIEDICTQYRCRVLFIGDPAQLKPVKQDTLSRVFDIEESVELTKVERQKDGNPLGFILDAIRNNKDYDQCPFDKITDLNDKGQGIECTGSPVEFFKLLTKGYKGLYDIDTSSVKMLAYTNDKVSLYNTIVRKALGFKEPMPVKGDILMAYDNILTGPTKYDPFKEICEIYNSADYEVLRAERRTMYKHGLVLKGQDFLLKPLGAINEANSKLFVLDKETEPRLLEDIGDVIESLREEGLRNGGKAWMPYFDFKSSFGCYSNIKSDGRVVKNRSFDYGYATTIHKSQGGTYHTVFVDDRDIDGCTDAEMKNQLKYVALSRPTEKAALFI
jgi:hypothetical protein